MKRPGMKLRFYALIGLLNMAVGVMFYVVNMHITIPTLADVVIVPPHPHPPIVAIKEGVPTHVTIPSLGIDLAVGVGTYNQSNGSWLVDATKAYYADMSLPINNHNGNTLIYGHAQAPVFARLPKIQPDSEALVTVDTGYVFRYHYQTMREVIPSDVSVFDTSGPPTLVLQTCMGDWDAYRGLFSFKLDSVEKV